MPSVKEIHHQAQANTSPTNILHEVLSRLENPVERGSNWLAHCPSHSDRNRSLNIKIGQRGILLKCWAGCSFHEIVAAIDLSPENIFFDKGQHTYERGSTFERADNPHWNWRRALNELHIIGECQRVKAEDFLEHASTIDRTTLDCEAVEVLEDQILLAEKWITAGENIAELTFAIAQAQRREEARR